MDINKRNPATWPKAARRAVDAIASVLMHAFMLARGRAAASGSPIVKIMAERDKKSWDS